LQTPQHDFQRDLLAHGKLAPGMHPLPLDTFGIALDRVLVIEEITVGAKGATSACIAVWYCTLYRQFATILCYL